MSPLLAATAGGLYVVEGGGEDLEEGLGPRHVTALTGRDGQLAAVADGATVFVRESAQAPWVETAHTDERLNCLVLHGGRLLAGAADARLFELRAGGLARVRSFDAVSGREDWYTPWGGPPDVRSLSVGAGAALYVGVHVGGIVRSRDGGATWEPTIDIHADVHQVLAHPTEPDLVLAASARGLEVSADGGDTWRTHAHGLHAPYARAVAVAGDTVLLSASTGPFTHRAAVYRAPLDPSGSIAFERCTNGLPEWFGSNVDTFCLAAHGDHVALGTEEGNLFTSEDAGRTWSLVTEGLPAIRAVVPA